MPLLESWLSICASVGTCGEAMTLMFGVKPSSVSPSTTRSVCWVICCRNCSTLTPCASAAASSSGGAWSGLAAISSASICCQPSGTSKLTPACAEVTSPAPEAELLSSELDSEAVSLEEAVSSDEPDSDPLDSALDSLLAVELLSPSPSESEPQAASGMMAAAASAAKVRVRRVRVIPGL